MSEHADKYSKAHRKERVDHILNSTKGKVDASGYTVPGELDTAKKTGPCQPKPRAFAKGGKVEGKSAHHHAGRKSRAPGGETVIQQLRPQVPTGGLYGAGFSPTHAGMMSQAGGLKKGGEAKNRACGGKAGERRLEMAKDAAKHKADGGGIANKVTGVRITGGRTARAEGGRAKGKTNINIIIGSPKGEGSPVPPPPSAMPPAPPPGPPGLPPAAMGAMSGPPMPMGGPGGPPPGMPPQMPPRMGPR